MTLSFGEGTEFVIELYRVMVVTNHHLVFGWDIAIFDLAVTVTTGVMQILIQQV